MLIICILINLCSALVCFPLGWGRTVISGVKAPRLSVTSPRGRCSEQCAGNISDCTPALTSPSFG